jgi:alanine-synthesizing transaminase
MNKTPVFRFSIRSDFGMDDFVETPVSPEASACEPKEDGVLDLTSSNPTSAGFDYSAYRSCYETTARSDALLHYVPDPCGMLSTRVAVCDYYREHYGSLIDPERMLLTASTSEAYTALFDLLADSGEAIMVPTPGYPLIEMIATTSGLQIIEYPLIRDQNGHWSLDTVAFEQLYHPSVKAVVWISPNNPTGAIISKQEIRFIEDFCLQHDLALIVDEVFRDYAAVETEHLGQLYKLKCLNFILNGFSKIAALPQLKLSWIILGGPKVWTQPAKARLEIVLDSLLSVSAFAQLVAPGLLGKVASLHEQIRARCNENYQVMQTACDGTDMRPDPYVGGWYGIIVPLAWHRKDDISLYLYKHAKVSVHPGYFYGLPERNAIVVSLITPVDTFQEGFRRIRQLIAST